MGLIHGGEVLLTFDQSGIFVKQLICNCDFTILVFFLPGYIFAWVLDWQLPLAAK